MRPSAFIEKDLKTRILTGEDIPDSLSLTDLSQHYGVSVTPVREAVLSLVDQEFFHYAAPETAVVEETTAQHCEILDCLLDRDADDAKAILADHIREQKTVIKKLLG